MSVAAIDDLPAGKVSGSRRPVGRGQRRAGRFRLVIGVTVALLVFAVSATAARADATFPPIRVFPAAGEAAPPASAIIVPPDATCTGWYTQSSYVGQPTGSTWWEYRCQFAWPQIEYGTGASDFSGGGQDVVDNFFYWDGSAPVFYGYWAYYGYWDDWLLASCCPYWTDEPSDLTYGPLDWSFDPMV